MTDQEYLEYQFSKDYQDYYRRYEMEWNDDIHFPYGVHPDNFFDCDCSWYRLVDKLREQKNDDLLEYLGALSDARLLCIKSSTDLEDIVRQIKRLKKSDNYHININQIASQYEDPDFLYRDYAELNYDFTLDQDRSIISIIWDIFEKRAKLCDASPRQFEEIVSELLSAQNFYVELTPKTKDNGRDIIAIKKSGTFLLKFVVECKRYTSKPVGIDVVRGFNDVISKEHANKGILVTSSRFTKGAWIRRHQLTHIMDFWDKDDVLYWIHKYCQDRI